MALKQDIPAGVLFIGEDKRLRLRIFDENGITPLDIGSMTFRWTFSQSPSDETALIAKTSAAGKITVSGVFNLIPASNTQYVEVEVDAEDTAAMFKGRYHHALRRADVGSRTVLTYGEVQLSEASR